MPMKTLKTVSPRTAVNALKKKKMIATALRLQVLCFSNLFLPYFAQVRKYDSVKIHLLNRCHTTFRRVILVLRFF